MTDMAAAIEAVESSFNVALTGSIRAAAITKGWSREQAALMSVRTDGGQILVSVEGGVEAVEPLEYGTLDEPAKPVIRRWLATMQSVHEAEYWSQVFDVALGEVSTDAD